MNANEYQQLALRTESKTESETTRLLQGIMGLCGEAGECLDLLKKHMFQEHYLSKTHLMKELGDVAWYLAVSADALGFSLEEIFEANIQKLKERYPNGEFEGDKSRNRKAGDV